jgi:hypothetical protein
MVLLRYTVLRAAIFLAVAALLWLIGLRGYPLVLAGILTSGIISVAVLRRSRDAVSATLDRRLSAIKERTAAEDAWDDERRREDGSE